MRVEYKRFNQLHLEDIMVYNAIPEHPFWDKVNQVVDFTFVDRICEPLYSPRGQRPYAPSLKLKVHLVQRYYDISDREMEQKIIGDIYIKRFLGLPVTHAKFDHSTIALDRGRLGAEMFHACHVYILAQAMAAGLWGSEDERWLVDSFHTNANVAAPSTHELIRQGTQKILRHLKNKNPLRYTQLKENMDVEAFFKKAKRNLPEKKLRAELSKTVVEAYGLLAWMERLEHENTSPFQSEEDSKVARGHCELLRRVLRENVKGLDTEQDDDGETGSGAASGSKEDSKDAGVDEDGQEPEVKYVEMDKKEKPTDRIVSIHDPDVRCGHKTARKMFFGDKVQVVETDQSHFVLDVEPISGNEPDGDALIPLVTGVINEFNRRPKEVVADSAYGWADNRKKAKERNLVLVAPIPKRSNPTNLYLSTKFQYIVEEDVMVCPANERSYRKIRIQKLQGTQYHFKKAICNACPLCDKCKKGEDGRSIFVSDHAELYEAARAYNKSPEGIAALKARYEIERANNELKRHHGLGEPRTRGRHNMRIAAKVAAMMVNIKRMVKMLTHPPKPAIAGEICP